ncbi:MAG: rRNA maturation RNase YbeY [Treponema sp.]|nr:rRNA maturation RNase YbeY [Treponema sp.]
MNAVFVRSEGVAPPAWARRAAAFVKKVLKILGRENWEVSVLFCGNQYIKALNVQYRGKDEPTDVLSFGAGEPAAEARESRGSPPESAAEARESRGSPPESAAGAGRYVAGDIVLSLDALEENARFFKVSADEELRRLLVHAILHLSGEDHATNNAEEPMLKCQEEILSRLAGEIIQENDR